MRRRNTWHWLAAAVLAALPCGAEILVCGRLEAPGGAPLPEAPVRLLPARDSHRAGLDLVAGRTEPRVEAVTGGDGRCEPQAPEAGSWEGSAAPGGFVPMRLEVTVPQLAGESTLATGIYDVAVTTPDGRRWQGSVRLSPGAGARLEL